MLGLQRVLSTIKFFIREKTYMYRLQRKQWLRVCVELLRDSVISRLHNGSYKKANNREVVITVKISVK